MVFVPLIGLSPFLIFHLFDARYIFKSFFISGIFVGFIPTFLNLYFSYQRFGIDGLTQLFEFVKKQAIGNDYLSDFFLIPLNSLYFTFPVGILLIFLYVFTRPNNNISYPLLVYYYPLISLTILLCMSTTYPHYFLFLLPSLSILFAMNLDSYSLRFSASNKYIKFIFLLLLIFISSIILSILIFFNNLLLEYSYRQNLLIYLVSLLLILSYINSARFLFDKNNTSLNFSRFFYNIVFPQYFLISLLYNFGIIGNPNFSTKSFINDSYISSIANSNTIYLYNLESKIQTLITYYLPSTKVISSLDSMSISDYVITSDRRVLDNSEYKHLFKSIRKFDNHYLLINIRK